MTENKPIRHDEPASAAQLMAALGLSDFSDPDAVAADRVVKLAALVDRCCLIRGEHWHDWFGDVLAALDSRDAVSEIFAGLERTEEMLTPNGRYLVTCIKNACKRAGVRWPKFPNEP